MRTATARVPGIDRVLHFEVHEHDDRHVSERIATEGTWEPFETELILRFLREPPAGVPEAERHLFVDCGANLGWYSVVAATLGAQVVAFEPLPANAALLRSNVARNALNDRVEIHELALGSEAPRGVLRLSADNQGDHRLIPDGIRAEPTSRRELIVEMGTLDSVLAGRRPTVIKIDTQGSEVAILRGGRSSWSEGNPVIVLEFWPYGLERCGASAAELLILLGEMVDVTHSCFEILEWRQALERVTMADLARMATLGGYSPAMKGFTNLVLVPRGKTGVVADLLVVR